MTYLRSARLVALLVTLSAAPSPAQQPMRMMSLEALDRSDPRAQLATRTVTLLLSGDRAEVETHLERSAAAVFLQSGDRVALLDRVMDELASAPYAIDGVSAAPEGQILVRLRDNAGGDPLAVILTLEPSPPHRITAIRSTRPRVNRSPGPGHGPEGHRHPFFGRAR